MTYAVSKSISAFSIKEMEDADSTLLSNATEEETNTLTGSGDSEFEVVTLESDYQVLMI